MQKLYTFCVVGEDVVMLQEQKKILCRKEKLQEGRKGVELALTTHTNPTFMAFVRRERKVGCRKR